MSETVSNLNDVSALVGIHLSLALDQEYALMSLLV